MLSDEERQAIEYLKRHIIPYYGRKGTIEFMINDTLLNLIEKQSKEIEYKNKIIEKTYNDINSKNKKLAEILDNKKFIDEMWQDKIKAKIEELEIEQESNREDLKIAIDNLIFQNIDKIGNKISINMSVRGVLQSLLEKE